MMTNKIKTIEYKDLYIEVNKIETEYISIIYSCASGFYCTNRCENEEKAIIEAKVFIDNLDI